MPTLYAIYILANGKWTNVGIIGSRSKADAIEQVKAALQNRYPCVIHATRPTAREYPPCFLPHWQDRFEAHITKGDYYR